MNLPASLAARLAQGFEKTPMILVIFENRLPPIAPGS